MSRTLVALAAGIVALALPGTAIAKCPDPGERGCPFTAVRTAVGAQGFLDIAVDDSGFIYGVTGGDSVIVYGPTGARTRVIPLANVGTAAAIDVAATGAVIAVADADGKVVTLEGATGNVIRTFGTSGAGQLQTPVDVALMPGGDGDPIVVDRGTNSVIRFDADSGQVVGQYGAPGVAPRSVAVSRTSPPVLRVGTAPNSAGRAVLLQLSANLRPLTQGVVLPTDAGSFSVGADELGNAYTIDNVTDTILVFGPGDELVNAWGSWGFPTTTLEQPLSVDVADRVLYVSEPSVGAGLVYAFTLAADAVAALPRAVAALDGAGRPATTVACRARGLRTCPVRITLRAGGRRVGGARVTLPAGARRAVVLSVAADVARRLRLGRDVRVSAEVRTRRPGRRDRVHTRALRLLGEDRR